MRLHTDSYAHEFLLAARKYEGYNGLPGDRTVFSAESGTDGLPAWDGAFLDYVAARSDFRLPAHVSTPAALGFYVRGGRLRKRPRLGDIVFLVQSAGDGRSPVAAPAVGIVTDGTAYRSDGVLRALVAQTASGLPRADTTPNGIFERTYYRTDVLAFARPDFEAARTLFFRAPATEPVDGYQIVTVAQLTTGKKHTSVELVQRALAATVGLSGASRGMFDLPTKSAYTSYQRYCGLVGSAADGKPDDTILSRLSRETGIFTTRG